MARVKANGKNGKGTKVSGRRNAARQPAAIVGHGDRAARPGSNQSTSAAKARSNATGESRVRSSAGQSKSARAVELLRRAEGATLMELMAVTGWQAHSVRGFLSGTVRKRMRFALRSTSGDAGRRYAIDVKASAHDAS